MENVSLQIILHSGNSKSSSMEAIEFARMNDFENADIKMNEAHEELVVAQKSQTRILKRKEKIDSLNPNLIFMHAQDQLTNAKIQYDLSKELINLYEEIYNIKQFLGMDRMNNNQTMKILLVCGQGMSTSLLVQAMYMYAREGDYIESTSFEELPSVIDEYDVLLASPQIRFRIPVIERMIKPRTQIVGLMDMKAYGKLDGETIYKQAEELFKKIKH